MRSLFFSLITILISFNGFAREVTEEQAYNALRLDLAKLKKTLTRDIRVYHWFGSQDRQLNRLAPKDGRFQYHAEYLAKEFFQMGDGNEVGPGFYAALDPQVSTEFGNILVEVGIKKGTSFLDIRSGHRYGLEVTLETKEILKEYCWNDFSQDETVYKYQGKKYASLFKLSIAANERCLGLLNKVVKSLDVEFLTYGWWATGENFDVCKGEETGAFLIFGKLLSSPYEFNNVEVDLSSFDVNGFVPAPNFSNLSKEDVNKYLFVDQLSKLSLVDYSGEKGRWSAFSRVKPWQNTELLEEVSTVRFGCDKDRFPEDRKLPFRK